MVVKGVGFGQELEEEGGGRGSGRERGLEGVEGDGGVGDREAGGEGGGEEDEVSVGEGKKGEGGLLA